MKLTHAAIVALSTALLITAGLLWASGKQHKAELAKLTLELETAKSNTKDCGAAILAQNNAIEKIRVDTVYLERNKEVIVNKYKVIRDTVTQILAGDNSCENQVNLIDGLLRGFSSGRMRAENRDQD